LLTPPLTKRFGFANQKDPEQVRREAQHQAEFEATMEPSRELHEAEKVAGDAVGHKLLMELLEPPAAEKAKVARRRLYVQVPKYKGCTREYSAADFR
jgi:hypothetical protein